MSDQNKDLKIYLRALKHHRGYSVLAMNKQDWKCFKGDGVNCVATAYIADPPAPLISFGNQATIIGSELCITSAEPKQMDIVRLDLDNQPKIYKKYRYFVYENPHLDTAYPSIVSSYGIEDSEELRTQLQDNVFLVGQYKDFPDHHTSQVAGTLLKVQ